jgi:hypothetical protein
VGPRDNRNDIAGLERVRVETAASHHRQRGHFDFVSLKLTGVVFDIQEDVRMRAA